MGSVEHLVGWVGLVWAVESGVEERRAGDCRVLYEMTSASNDADDDRKTYITQ